MDNKLAVIKDFKLPKINELIDDSDMKLSEINDLNILLNQTPPAKWLKNHPYVKNLVYLPIERVEYLLTRLFFRWRVEIKDTKLIGNSIVINVRLHYFNPILNEWDWQDGVGASPLQTDKDSGAIEFNKLKSGAVMMSAPAAKSYAVKDAAEQIGAIFGKNLNRADKANYDTLAENPALKEKEQKFEQLFND